jgi:hypothetical protein
MTATFRAAIALTFAVLLASCGVKQSMEDAGVGIEQFHARYDKENYDAIWGTTSTEFRKITTQKQFEQLLIAIRGKLGAVKSSKQQGWQANTNNGVSTVVISTQTTFEKGDGTETFTFVREGEALKLLGYNLQSAALIAN